MTLKEERGAITVEATLYFPITIAVVMAVIYLGLFKMQESYFFFQAERAAALFAREIAYPGYESFQEGELLKDSQIDFSWEDGPSKEQAASYYEAYQGSLTKIYRLGLGSDTQERIGDYQEALAKYSALFSMGSTKAYVKVNNSFFSKSVQVEVRYEIPTPGILRYIGAEDQLCLYAGAYQPVINTTDFVRNVDLAWDLGDFLLKKLGFGDQADAFVESFHKVKDIIL